MNWIKAADAQKLTGLTRNQLREWTGRRALILADVPPKASGSDALFSWQTILTLRLAAVMREEFRMELKTHRTLFRQIRDALIDTPILSLRGKCIAIYGGKNLGGENWNLVDRTERLNETDNVFLFSLDPHLDALAIGFEIREPTAQLLLFPATAVG